MLVRRKKKVCTSIDWILSSTGKNPFPHPLMAWVETAGVAPHGDQSGFFLDPTRRLGVFRVSASGISI